MSEKEDAAMAIAGYHLRVREQAARAREHYEETGTVLALDEVPELNLLCHAAFASVQYASQAIHLTRDLPKRFTFLSSEYLLVFPPEGKVQIADPLTHQNFCIGLPGWVDPMKVKPKARG